MDERSPETRRRFRLAGPPATFIGGLFVIAAVLAAIILVIWGIGGCGGEGAEGS